MILLVPQSAGVQPIDLRLARLAEFLGIECRNIQLEKSSGDWAEYLEDAAPREDTCFVVNPAVLREWTGTETLPKKLASFLVAHFQHLLVHAISRSTFDTSVVQELSGGSLQGVHEIEGGDHPYVMSASSKDVCGAFTGLSFGRAKPTNDCVFLRGREENETRTLISIADLPFMAVREMENCKIWFIAGREVADLDARAGGIPLSEYFSLLMPHAMALRALSGEESWHPRNQYGSVVIDDPLLRPDYGALNFEALLALMKKHNFHTTLAFIPYNFKRSSRRTVRLLLENSSRFALCFHGNDHMGAEFASTDRGWLDTSLHIAQERMKKHQAMTGLDCDRVMVFPQGKFSLQAMAAIKAHNFDGAVNTTPHPMREENRLTLAEIARPAVLRYGDFPLFLRKGSLHTADEDIAFSAFFGRPILIVEHHDVFQRPEQLIDAVGRINKIVPDIRWSNLGAVLRNSVLWKRTSMGVSHVLAYARTVQLVNESETSIQCLLEWPRSPEPEISTEQMLLDGTPVVNSATIPDRFRVSVALSAHGTRTLSLIQKTVPGRAESLGVRHNARAFVRRRLSEVRDNYVSKSPRVLAVVKSVQKRLIHSERAR
jgi:peptidoglycan/xylan/chitin deacetylase (PgdA/CDA1 family)